jgi:hypothetical protein
VPMLTSRTGKCSSPRRTTLPLTGASPCKPWCYVSFQNPRIQTILISPKLVAPLSIVVLLSYTIPSQSHYMQFYRRRIVSAIFSTLSEFLIYSWKWFKVRSIGR